MITYLKGAVRRRLLMQRHQGLSIASGAHISSSRFGSWIDIAKDATIIHASIGDYSYVGPRSTIAFADVGRFCSIASEVIVGSGSHPSRGSISSHPAFYLKRPERGWAFAAEDMIPDFAQTVVGSDVWLGAKTVLRDGVRVGDGAIIGAGAIVVKDAEPYGVYVGAPARLIRKRFTEEEIEKLLALRWWSRDSAWLQANAALFLDPPAFFASLKG